MAKDHATDLTAVHIDNVTCKYYTYKSIFFTAPWTSEMLYSLKHYVMVLHEGPVNLLFDTEALEPPSPSSSQGTSADGNDKERIDEANSHQMGNQAKDIALVQNQGHEVDDDNKPAP